MDMKLLENTIEAIVFASGTSIKKELIFNALEDVSNKKIEQAIQNLKKRYDELDSGISFLTIKDKLRFSSNPKYSELASTILTPLKEKELTKVLLEVLAIIAYSQPITRMEIDDIRGVSSDYALSVLLRVGLIEVVGKKDTIGKPSLYGTTDEFLNKFSLNSLDDLPDYNEILIKLNQFQDPLLRGDSLYKEYDVKNEENEKNKLTPEEIRKKREIDSQIKKEQLESIDDKISEISSFIDKTLLSNIDNIEKEDN